MQSEQLSRPNYLFLVTIFILLGFGLVMVFSSTYYLGYSQEDTFLYLKAHIIRLAIGIIGFLAASRMRYRVWSKVSFLIILLSLLMLVITWALGNRLYGARRWIQFASFGVQPSEFAKFALIFYLARFFSKRSNTLRKEQNLFLPPALVSLIVILLVALQPSLGTAILISLSAFSLFLIAGVRLKYLLVVSALSIMGFSLLILAFPHARARVNVFLNGKHYQAVQSKIAVGSGQLLGEGLGEGKQKLKFLPKPHTDFIYAIIAEELGFVGTLLVFTLFFLFFLQGMNIALKAADSFGFLLATGLTISPFLYFLAHTGVALGLLPVTGLPLPFISFGGSALISNLFAVGCIYNISKYGTNRRIDEDYISRRWYWRSHLPDYRTG